MFGEKDYAETGYDSIRYPDPAIKVNDTVKIELSTGTHAPPLFLTSQTH